jgi:DNA-binding ferritin-like protein (Dps family)
MTNLLTKILGDKREWKAMEARANVLPGDYRVVYGEMKSHAWRFATGGGMNIVDVLKVALGLFETSAAHDHSVLDVPHGE